MRRATALYSLMILLLPGLVVAGEGDLFSPRDVAADLSGPPPLGVVRARPVTVDFGALPAADGTSALPPIGHSLGLNLFDDVVLSASMSRTARLAGGVSWSGHLDGEPLSSVDIVVHDGVLTGTVNGEAGSFRIGWNGGGQVVQEMDYAQFPEGHDCALHAPSAPPVAADPDPQMALDDGSIVDVMIVYTPAARIAQGGVTAMESLINLAITETNTAYANSGVIQRLRLVHTAEVSLTETPGDGGWSTDLNRLTNTSDGYIDNVHTLRETYKPDLVSLFGHGYSGWGNCGVAWLMAGNNPGFAANAFSVVDRTCATGYYSFGHEIGHNQGLNHARVDPVGTGAYSYSYGHKWPGYRSVMAYSPGTRVQHFSNPNVSHSGYPTGIIETAPDSAHNTLSLNNTRVTVANWRARTPTVAVTVPERRRIVARRIGPDDHLDRLGARPRRDPHPHLHRRGIDLAHRLRPRPDHDVPPLDRSEQPGIRLLGHGLQRRERGVRGVRFQQRHLLDHRRQSRPLRVPEWPGPGLRLVGALGHQLRGGLRRSLSGRDAGDPDGHR